MKKPSIIRFADAKIKMAFTELKNSDEEAFKFISQAINNLKENAFAGLQLPKRLFPREYVKRYKITNLWKYNLPNAWRLLYTVKGEEVITQRI